jgi:hypothetical protein
MRKEKALRKLRLEKKAVVMNITMDEISNFS